MRLEDCLSYPSFRPGQKELAAAAYEAGSNGKTLIAEAMSGFGKTAAILSGALLAAREKNLRILYTCRTKRQVFRLMEEVSALRAKTEVEAATLSSKREYCLLMGKTSQQATSESFGWFCSFHTTNNLCSYFLNLSLVREGVDRVVKLYTRDPLSHASLMKECETIHVCPYEVARLGVGSAEIIGLTYHYVFNESARSVLLTASQLEPSKTILIIDEAHNLKDFIRDTSASEITLKDIDKSISESKDLYFDNTTEILDTLKERFKTFCLQSEGWQADKRTLLRVLSEGQDEFWLSNLSFELSTCANAGWYAAATTRAMPESILKVGKFLTRFLSSLEVASMALVKSDDSVRIIDTNPSKSFTDATRGFASRILISATIGPSSLFLRSLGLDHPSVQTHEATPQYTSLRIKTVLDTGVSTRFKLRTDETYRKIASKVTAAASASKENVGVFMPSYSVLESLTGPIESGAPNRTVLVEKRGAPSAKADEMISAFKSGKKSILLAVQGGRFSEGEDFRDDQMGISIVVGLSLPPPSPTLFAEYAYLRSTNQPDSFTMLSLLPALRKAFQSAGRHIRTPSKRGMVFLLDSRYNDRRAFSLMPSWLTRDIAVGDFSNDQIREIVQEFESPTRST